MLTNATPVTDANGRSLNLPAGEVVHLADGVPLTLAGVAVRLAGNKILRLSDEVEVDSAPGAAATLSAQTEARRTNGAVVRLDADTAATLTDGAPRPVLYGDIFSPARYNPSALVTPPYPVKDLDFTSGGAYSVYNWELFFHVPLTIAMHLSKTGRYAEAQRWFHFLFDPTDDSDGPTPERFWKVRPFQTTDVQKIEEILVNLATNANETLRDETIQSINAWQDTPFRPHVVARYRQQAYMYKTVMAYLDNLIAWGDSLFRQDTGEAIDEALILYVLAANILGPRPQAVPQKGTVRPQTYDNLRKDLQLFGVVLRDVEADIGFDATPPPAEDGDNPQLATVRSLGKALYFCVPRNDKLLSYWDTVADRLFKIHNSLNIQGIFRQLALFEPPIDPAMLARAAAAGLDVAAIINGLNQPLPLVRFQLLAQKAGEVVQEVKSLGNSLLSAMEKEDGEALGLLRAKHERAILELVEQVKYGQLQEAIKAREGLLGSLALAVQRYTYYELQLGRSLDDIQKAIPELDELDDAALDKMKFKMDEPALQPAELIVDIASSLEEAGGKIFSSFEAGEFASLARAVGLRGGAAELDMAGKFLSLIPDFGAQAEPWGIGAAITFGGKALSTSMALVADSDRILADKASHEAGKSSRIAGFDRRQLDWTFQSNLAVGEINQIFKQLRAAQLREAVAALELRNHRRQMQHAVEIEHFLNEEGAHKTGKKTNKSLYTWMKREVRGLYGQVFQFAFDIAKKAERALQHELGDPSLSYLQFGYLAGKEGLLAGEKLYLDVKRMEMAYLELNRREYELTKHVSLLQVDPLALIELRATGRCTVRLPEELFDMDGPGHYFRRIKSVAVSIPCITGPYAGVNCTLTLLKSSVRTTPVVGDEYARADAEDTRFNDYFGSLQSIVTSSGQNDSGLFETNLRDERYLPFENSGVISEWQLQLPANPSKGEPRQFDYDTISDVILHVRYTAREGGGLLRQRAIAHNNDLFTEARAVGAVRLFSVRHEFPGEWARLQAAPPAGQRRALALTLRPEHFPFWSQGRLGAITRVDVVARSAEKPVPGSLDVFDAQGGAARKSTLVKRTEWGGLLAGALTDEPDTIPLPTPDGEWQLFFDKPLAELWLAMRWGE
ncbi:MAG: insecticidal toxin protein [Candidatus Promineofilum sp.]|nr:insecticidal toxin protein [Promineifilum sp.]